MENSVVPFGFTDTELHFRPFKLGLVEYPGRGIK